MGWNDPNVYSNPGDFGLTFIGELDAGFMYDFDILAFYVHENGEVYMFEDSGCSCPSPFEYHNSLGSGELVTKERLPEIKNRIRSHAKHRGSITHDEREHLIHEVSKYFK